VKGSSSQVEWSFAYKGQPFKVKVGVVASGRASYVERVTFLVKKGGRLEKVLVERYSLGEFLKLHLAIEKLLRKYHPLKGRRIVALDDVADNLAEIVALAKRSRSTLLKLAKEVEG